MSENARLANELQTQGEAVARLKDTVEDAEAAVRREAGALLETALDYIDQAIELLRRGNEEV